MALTTTELHVQVTAFNDDRFPLAQAILLGYDERQSVQLHLVHEGVGNLAPHINK